jgi:L-aminopeptidase/D-esterase-like protein
VVEIGGERYVVGVLVQANFGARSDLMVAGVPVGKEITDLEPIEKQDGSVIVVIVTDAPLSSSQLNLVARRATLGIGRTGTIGSNGSGDLFLACSTAENEFDPILNIVTSRSLAKSSLDGIYRATVEATEEAVINAMVAAETMEGINGNTVFALPHDRLRDALKKYNRLPGE